MHLAFWQSRMMLFCRHFVTLMCSHIPVTYSSCDVEYESQLLLYEVDMSCFLTIMHGILLLTCTFVIYICCHIPVIFYHVTRIWDASISLWRRYDPFCDCRTWCYIVDTFLPMYAVISQSLVCHTTDNWSHIHTLMTSWGFHIIWVCN